MTCCEIIKTVLDEAWEAIDGADADKVKQIKEQMDVLSEKYRQAWEVAPDLNFGDPVVRFAYIYRRD